MNASASSVTAASTFRSRHNPRKRKISSVWVRGTEDEAPLLVPVQVADVTAERRALVDP